jgi:hypothetical protein
MAFGRTFGQVVEDVALQLGRNTAATANQGYRAKVGALVRRAYEELLDEHEWPFLHGTFSKTTQAGQRFYDFPENTQFGKLYAPHVFYSGKPEPLIAGITIHDYGVYHPDTERADPPLKWDVRVNNSGVAQIELWPTPRTNGQVIWFEGQRAPAAPTTDNVVLALDDQLVALWTLMEEAEAEGRKNFKILQAKANRRLQLQKARFAPSDGFSMLNRRPQFRRPPGEIRIARSDG